jgi:hemerythrin
VHEQESKPISLAALSPAFRTGRYWMTISWTDDLNTGIEVIDKQHMRIVDYINDLELAHQKQDHEAVGRVLDDLVDYTLSHFAFEESLQEEAGYEYCKPHKKVHELFVRRVNEYVERFRLGDDVTAEIHKLLKSWLINHIKRDDADYVAAVKANMIGIISEKEKKKDIGWFRRFFK